MKTDLPHSRPCRPGLTRFGIAALILALSWIAPTAQAQLIISYQWGHNFNNGRINNSPGGTGAGRTGGVESAAYWNGSNGQISGSASNLMDSTGAASTLDIAWSSGASYMFTDSAASSTANQSLYSFGLRAAYNQTISIDLTDIPFSEYDLIVYVNRQFGVNSVGLTLDGGTPVPVVGISGGSTRTADPFFVEVTPSVTAGNYVRFSGLTGTSHTFGFTNAGDPLGISGFQIVQTVPEPSAIILVLGGLIVGFCRRRRLHRSA